MWTKSTYQLTVLYMEKRFITAVIKAISWAYEEDLKVNSVTARDNPTSAWTDTTDHKQIEQQVRQQIQHSHANNNPQAARKEGQYSPIKTAFISAQLRYYLRKLSPPYKNSPETDDEYPVFIYNTYDTNYNSDTSIISLAQMITKKAVQIMNQKLHVLHNSIYRI